MSDVDGGRDLVTVDTVVSRISTRVSVGDYSLKMLEITHPNPTCQKCDAGMVLYGIAPYTEGYDLWSYRCLICKSAFNIVEARQRKAAG